MSKAPAVNGIQKDFLKKDYLFKLALSSPSPASPQDTTNACRFALFRHFHARFSNQFPNYSSVFVEPPHGRRKDQQIKSQTMAASNSSSNYGRPETQNTNRAFKRSINARNPRTRPDLSCSTRINNRPVDCSTKRDAFSVISTSIVESISVEGPSEMTSN